MAHKHHSRPVTKQLFVQSDRQLKVYFYTSNIDKFLQARAVARCFGLSVSHFKSKQDPYSEDYALGKQALLRKALDEVSQSVGASALFFVEDTSVRIDALSKKADYPGLAVKEWFAQTSFRSLSTELKQRRNNRAATVRSDVALHVPQLRRPVYFSGETHGCVAASAPRFSRNKIYPWLTPDSFNGWLIPDGANRRLGEMSFEESWEYDFRVQSLVSMFERLEEYAGILNLPRAAYSLRDRSHTASQPMLFGERKPIVVVVGPTCSGKTTFGQRTFDNHSRVFVDASSIVRMFKEEGVKGPTGPFDYALRLLQEKGPDVVARRILELYSSDLDEGLVITGFRTIEELEAIKATGRQVQIIFIDASERTRFERLLRRSRGNSLPTIQTLRDLDQQQQTFGLLPVAEHFADIKVVNEGSLDLFADQVDMALNENTGGSVKGVSRRIRPPMLAEHNQLYRCLSVLNIADRPMTSLEIAAATTLDRRPVVQNNVNKVLGGALGLAVRHRKTGRLYTYSITPAGRAYLRAVQGT